MENWIIHVRKKRTYFEDTFQGKIDSFGFLISGMENSLFNNQTQADVQLVYINSVCPPIDMTLNVQYTNVNHDASVTENALDNKVHITDITQLSQQRL